MKYINKRLWFAGMWTIFLLLWWRVFSPPQQQEAKIPNDWFYAQRAYPQGEINHQAYREGQRQVLALREAAAIRESASWQPAGPRNVGGRISDLELSPTSFDTIYAGTASGGIFRSVDAGNSWEPVFDGALSLSIGDLALDPANPRIIYAGTGEVNAGGGSQTYDGTGLYRSSDAGESWAHLGLEDTRYISRVVIDPKDLQRIFVGAMGKLFAGSAERGLYRSTDGGQSWEQKLFISDSTGCIDVAIHPHHPDTLYAAMWERIRMPHRRSYGGLTSGLYRSHDGGENWIELTNGIPNHSPNIGRIGIAIAASNPAVLYAIYADATGFFAGVYKSIDHGDSWTRTNDGALGSVYSSFGWWFGNIRIDPTNPDVAYVLGLSIYKTTNGGQSWFYSSSGIHVDQHGLYIHPQNPAYLVAGNDGGIYISQNGGSSYSKSYHLPITQFYTGEIDYQQPQRLYGGTQDNGTIRTLSGGLDDWQQIYGGDGFYVRVDPEDHSYMYAESQYGGLGRSTNGGSSFTSALSGISGADRKNWNSPLELDPNTPQVLYFGTHRLYQSTNRAQSWTAISGDLTAGPSPGNLVFGTLTTIAVAPADGSVIYTGSDDGTVSVTLNGSDWSNISAGLPQRWITRVTVDPQDAHSAYVTLSGYRWDEYLPHIFRTTDAGSSWEDISGNLPEIPLNDVIVDPADDSTLFVAGDGGVFVTRNLGAQWDYLGSDLPLVPVTDLTLHHPTRTLLAATYGRSMFKYDLNQLTSLPAQRDAELPGDFHLAQNYPNPFNQSTVISYQLSVAGEVNLSVFNLLGERVATLVSESQNAGNHRVSWDGRDERGNVLASGTYIFRLKFGQRSVAKRMVLIR
ncbi:MAG: T9SS type A sorting domain-containing protein [Calditrichae bacterium]|nr:T9SS type A sorting domain-containing protein [Calditrichia bacterium]